MQIDIYNFTQIYFKYLNNLILSSFFKL